MNNGNQFASYWDYFLKRRNLQTSLTAISPYPQIILFAFPRGRAARRRVRRRQERCGSTPSASVTEIKPVMLFVVCFCSTFTIVLTSTPGKLLRSVKILNERFTGSKYLQIAPWCTDKLGDDKCLFHAGPANRAQRVARSYLCKFQRLLFFPVALVKKSRSV